MKTFIILLNILISSSIFAQNYDESYDIDTSYLFEINDSILEANGIKSYNNIFLVQKNCQLLENDCLEQQVQWGPSDFKITQDSTIYFSIKYDYSFSNFGGFSLFSILGFNTKSDKLFDVYFHPDAFILFKNTEILDWNKETFNIDNIVSSIESRKEVKIKSMESLEFVVLSEGLCKDVFFTKNRYSRLTPYEIALVLTFVNGDEIVERNVGYDSGCRTAVFSLETLNSITFKELEFVFATEEQFFYPNNRKHSKKARDYNVVRFHEIKLSFIEHHVTSDGLFSNRSGIEH
jgi:hypothetical protein